MNNMKKLIIILSLLLAFSAVPSVSASSPCVWNPVLRIVQCF